MHLLVDKVPFHIPRTDHQDVDGVWMCAHHLRSGSSQQEANGLLRYRRPKVPVLGGVEMVHQVRVVALKRHDGLTSQFIAGETVLISNIRQPVVGSLLVGIQGLA